LQGLLLGQAETGWVALSPKSQKQRSQKPTASKTNGLKNQRFQPVPESSARLPP
jgi:hypothetical protein